MLIGIAVVLILAISKRVSAEEASIADRNTLDA
jgi:hypothetical protein